MHIRVSAARPQRSRLCSAQSTGATSPPRQARGDRVLSTPREAAHRRETALVHAGFLATEA